MNQRTVGTIAATALLASGLMLAQTKPAVELEGAIAKEQVSGDLKAAISTYQKIAAENSAPRDVRAKALLHLAGCYEKLGQQKSRIVYEQIMRDFGDQPAAKQARARLVALQARVHPTIPATMTQHRIDAGNKEFGPGDTDGHRMVYFDNEKRELIYGDIGGGNAQVLFRGDTEHPFRWFTSRDLSKVFISFDSTKRFAVIGSDGQSYGEPPFIDFVNMDDRCGRWSWEGRAILLCGEFPDHTSHLLSITVPNGESRELVSSKTERVTNAVFSPDGRFVAYQLDASVSGHASRIFVLSANGGESRQVYEELPAGESSDVDRLRLLDWTADGHFLIIVSQLTGRSALHLLPIRDGKSTGTPMFVQYGEFQDGRTTSSGSLVYSRLRPDKFWAIYAAHLDNGSHPGVWKRLDHPIGSMSYPLPGWSFDSNQIVYVVSNGEFNPSGKSVVHLYDISTASDREVFGGAGYTQCVWASRGLTLFCINSAEENKLFSLSSDSGTIAPLATLPPPDGYFMMGYPDNNDQAVYIQQMSNAGWKEFRWEIASRQLTVSPLTKHVDGHPPIADRQQWLVVRRGQTLEVRSRLGGEWMPLVQLSKKLPDAAIVSAFSRDGKWLYYRDLDSSGKPSLFRVRTTGAVPERLGELPSLALGGGIRISPDNSTIALAACCAGTNDDVWLLENFVPAEPKR